MTPDRKIIIMQISFTVFFGLLWIALSALTHSDIGIYVALAAIFSNLIMKGKR